MTVDFDDSHRQTQRLHGGKNSKHYCTMILSSFLFKLTSNPSMQPDSYQTSCYFKKSPQTSEVNFNVLRNWKYKNIIHRQSIFTHLFVTENTHSYILLTYHKFPKKKKERKKSSIHVNIATMFQNSIKKQNLEYNIKAIWLWLAINEIHAIML